MNLLRLAWKNLVASPLSTLLSLILFALGVGLVSFILLLNHQLDGKFERNLAGIDMVVGAKGSPLQIILCSIFHIDFPTGNIPLKQANGLKRNPMIERTIDMALGDSHKGFRIVGTTSDYVDLYQGKLAEGKLWEKTYEVTVGAAVAKNLDLKLGSEFHSSHGFAEDGFEHDHGDHFRVVGILEGGGSVLDQLILTNIESVWAVHDHGPDTIALEDRDITSMLVFFKSRMANVKLPRMINENTDMQAASPAFEMARLYNMMGAGESMLRMLAFIIIGVSGLSIFISLFNSLRSRKYELALMRVSGASRGWLFLLMITEGLLIALLGYLLGMLLSHGGMELLSGYLSQEYRYDFTGWMLLPLEWDMFKAAMGIGFLAAAVPAIIAFNTDISTTLSDGMMKPYNRARIVASSFLLPTLAVLFVFYERLRQYLSLRNYPDDYEPGIINWLHPNTIFYTDWTLKILLMAGLGYAVYALVKYRGKIKKKTDYLVFSIPIIGWVLYWVFHFIFKAM